MQGQQPHTPYNINSSSSANDRLQKAIERNRMRQAKKQARQNTVQQKTTPQKNYQQQEFMFRPKSSSLNSFKGQLASEGRVGVATAGTETQFVRPAKNPTRKVGANSIHYPLKKTSTTKRKRARKKKTQKKWLHQIAWVVLTLIFLRLLFAERGLFDYFAMKDLIRHKNQLIEQTKLKNKELEQEMFKIRNSPQYQKEIVRQKLGFISADEYIVIFSEDSVPQKNEADLNP